MIGLFLVAAIPLVGVTGEHLKARAFFDANNVKYGDGLILTVDFIGAADFKALHPPALAKFVSSADWDLDDKSAKTKTIDVARRLTYRVAPRRAGVLWFPALEFEYQTPAGERRTVRSNEIPVHVKPGDAVKMPEMPKRAEVRSPRDGLVTDPGVALSDDERFAWRRACARTDLSAEAFVPFDFPAARLNEAWCAIQEGKWERAIAIYSRLEWRTGQTPEIERGIVAALAARDGTPSAELPIWRQVGRPILQFGWKGRLFLVGGGLAVLLLVFWLLGRAIRALACVGLALLVAIPAFADDPLAEMERLHEEMNRRLQQSMSGAMNGTGFTINFGGSRQEAPKVSARLELSNPAPRVGETFDFIVSLEVPQGCSVTPSNFSATQGFGLSFVTGGGRMLADGQSAQTSNIVKRIAIPARYDVPFKGDVGFLVGGMVSGQQRQGGRNTHFSFSFSNSFEARTPLVPIEVRPLQDAPSDYSGIVSTDLAFVETADALNVGTNDVIVLTYRMNVKGWLPGDWLPEGAAFECGRTQDRTGATTAEWQRYVVADGCTMTPEVKVVYYDPSAKKYKTVRTGGTKIMYNRK